MIEERAFFRWILPVSWAFLIAILMFSQPSAKVPAFRGADKIAHAALFGIFAVLLYRSFSDSSKYPALIAGLISSAYGALTEFFQLFLPNRRADIWDLFADISGVLVAIAFIQLRKLSY